MRSSELHAEAGHAAATFMGAPRDGYKLQKCRHPRYCTNFTIIVTVASAKKVNLKCFVFCSLSRCEIETPSSRKSLRPARDKTRINEVCLPAVTLQEKLYSPLPQYAKPNVITLLIRYLPRPFRRKQSNPANEPPSTPRAGGQRYAKR